MDLEQRISRLRSKRLLSDLFEWPTTPVLYRQPSSNELNAAKKQRDIFKCVHGKHYFTPCMHCQRTQQDADKWLKFYEEKTLKLRKQLGVTK
jgi:hypothetical protein